MNKTIKTIKKLAKILVVLILILMISVFTINYCIVKSTENKIYKCADSIPKHKTAIVLGTGKYIRKNYVNPYYKYRIDAAVKLFNANKTTYFIASGDNHIINYNEPKNIKNDLVKNGIRENNIYLDYAGFRTLDSMVRCKKIFGQDSIIVISQPFHLYRAIYIAKHYDINAVGFEATDVHVKYGYGVRIREVLARVKAFIDLKIINKQPKFLGEPIIIK